MAHACWPSATRRFEYRRRRRFTAMPPGMPSLDFFGAVAGFTMLARSDGIFVSIMTVLCASHRLFRPRLLDFDAAVVRGRMFFERIRRR